MTARKRIADRTVKLLRRVKNEYVIRGLSKIRMTMYISGGRLSYWVGQVAGKTPECCLAIRVITAGIFRRLCSPHLRLRAGQQRAELRIYAQLVKGGLVAEPIGKRRGIFGFFL